MNRLVNAGTRSRYEASVRVLLVWWEDNKLTPKTIDDFDEAASEYVEACWAEGATLGEANDALSGLTHFLPRVAGKLRQAWRLTKAWGRAEPPTRAAPISPLIVLGLAGAAIRCDLLGVAAGLLVGFDGMLRSGEIFKLRAGHCKILKAKAIIRIPTSKSGARKGATEMVVIESRAAVAILQDAIAGLAPDAFVVRRTPSKFREFFRMTCEAFGLADAGLKVYSLRRGGATWKFLEHGSMEKALLQGRWQSTATARIYIEDAAAASTALSLTEAQVADLTWAASAVQGHFCY